MLAQSFTFNLLVGEKAELLENVVFKFATPIIHEIV